VSTRLSEPVKTRKSLPLTERDLADLERRARSEDRPDLLLLIRGAVIHTEADIKWLDVCLEELASLSTYHPKLP